MAKDRRGRHGKGEQCDMAKESSARKRQQGGRMKGGNSKKLKCHLHFVKVEKGK